MGQNSNVILMGNENIKVHHKERKMVTKIDLWQNRLCTEQNIYLSWNFYTTAGRNGRFISHGWL